MSNEPSTISEKSIEVVCKGSSDEEGTIDVVPNGEDLEDQDLKAERETTRAPIHEPESPDDEYPDGGMRAWLVVFGVRSVYPSLCEESD